MPNNEEAENFKGLAANNKNNYSCNYKYNQNYKRKKENVLNNSNLKICTSDENSSECQKEDNKIIIFPGNTADHNLIITGAEENKSSADEDENPGEIMFIKKPRKNKSKKLKNSLSKIQFENPNLRLNFLEDRNSDKNQEVISPLRFKYFQSNEDISQNNLQNQLLSSNMQKNSNSKLNIITEYLSDEFNSDLIIKNSQNINFINELINVIVPFNKKSSSYVNPNINNNFNF